MARDTREYRVRDWREGLGGGRRIDSIYPGIEWTMFQYGTSVLKDAMKVLENHLESAVVRPRTQQVATNV